MIKVHWSLLILLLCIFYGCKERPIESVETKQEILDTISKAEEVDANKSTDTLVPETIVKPESAITVKEEPKPVNKTAKPKSTAKPSPSVSPISQEEKETLPTSKEKTKNEDVIQEIKPDNKPAKAIEIEKSPSPPPSPKVSDKIDHQIWDNDLRKFVDSNGKVNYAAWSKNRTNLDAYVLALSENVPSTKASLSERMAYWINVYNANTVKLILDNYPLKSIQSIDGGKPWDTRIVKSGYSYYSLNEVENKIIRPMGDARIHFAVNCAAKSCPKLMNKAYTAANLEASLAANTKAFLTKNEFVVNKDKMIISKIFEWYNDDFGDIKSWIGKQMGINVSPNAKVIYKDYDWDLNN